jgi:shikimate kinase
MSRVLLVGMMATGKTTVGRAIAERTGWTYVDNDELVVRATGLTARDLLARDGEPALRAAESAVLTSLLGRPAPLVAGVPGGVVLDAADRDRLRAGGHVVWLRAQVATLAERVGPATDRPWLGDDTTTALARLSAERAPLYAEVATQVVDVDGRSPDELAGLVLAELGPAGSPGQ